MQNEEEYQPELISRRGEYIAWGTFVLAGATWVFLLVLGTDIHSALRFLTIFLLGSSLMISFGNWMDRKTKLRITPDKLYYQNGLRRAGFDWNEIQKVEVYPSSWGDKVRVKSFQQHFSFRTLGEVEMKGEVKARMGFAKGEEILKVIIENAGLEDTQKTNSGYTYQRE